jgi:hypothetical protein
MSYYPENRQKTGADPILSELENSLDENVLRPG